MRDCSQKSKKLMNPIVRQGLKSNLWEPIIQSSTALHSPPQYLLPYYIHDRKPTKTPLPSQKTSKSPDYTSPARCYTKAGNQLGDVVSTQTGYLDA